jgi:hypothetical protein
MDYNSSNEPCQQEMGFEEDQENQEDQEVFAELLHQIEVASEFFDENDMNWPDTGLIEPPVKPETFVEPAIQRDPKGVLGDSVETAVLTLLEDMFLRDERHNGYEGNQLGLIQVFVQRLPQDEEALIKISTVGSHIHEPTTRYLTGKLKDGVFTIC